ncbi:CGNR zinc finger domain-containing protein [Phaeobacter sp. C3_T13_0]|uniref:CGNR zinc finger domain-containing protein n=1 Tax=Phaeobacter cretensis TaxID=3342641 RepID=UPI0039BC2C5C
MIDARPAPFFIGDSTALDFINSLAAPRSVEFEWLASGADVLDWLVEAGLITVDEQSVLRQPKHRTALDLAAEDIRAFREDFRSFVSDIIEDKQVPADHQMIIKLNRLMGQGKQLLRLFPSGSNDKGFELKIIHEIQCADDLLPRITTACAEFVAQADLKHVRRCEGSGCTLFFHDISKNHKRRWCSMEVCGNRAKAAAYRKRS